MRTRGVAVVRSTDGLSVSLPFSPRVHYPLARDHINTSNPNISDYWRLKRICYLNTDETVFYYRQYSWIAQCQTYACYCNVSRRRHRQPASAGLTYAAAPSPTARAATPSAPAAATALATPTAA